MKTPKIEVKNIKTMSGMDGEIIRASVYVNGKRSFSMFNDGWGTDNLYEPFDDEGEKTLELCEKYVKTLPEIESQFGGTFSTNLDIVLEDIISDTLEKKQIAGWCKKKTIFRLPNDKEGSYRTISHVFDVDVKKHVLNKYPNAIIMNELV